MNLNLTLLLFSPLFLVRYIKIFNHSLKNKIRQKPGSFTGILPKGYSATLMLVTDIGESLFGDILVTVRHQPQVTNITVAGKS